MNLFYGSRVAPMAAELGVQIKTVKRWLVGGSIDSDVLKVMRGMGINVLWLIDESDSSYDGMFSDTEQGSILKERGCQQYNSKDVGAVGKRTGKAGPTAKKSRSTRRQTKA